MAPFAVNTRFNNGVLSPSRAYKSDSNKINCPLGCITSVDRSCHCCDTYQCSRTCRRLAPQRSSALIALDNLGLAGLERVRALCLEAATTVRALCVDADWLEVLLERWRGPMARPRLVV